TLLRVVAASAAIGALLWGVLRVVPEDRIAGWKGAAILAAIIAAAAAFYTVAAHLLGSPEPAELKRVARRRRA
ncbi:MAG: lipid II flippase MurJ, partial [Thermoanaerobaculia bacterium]